MKWLLILKTQILNLLSNLLYISFETLPDFSTVDKGPTNPWA